MNYLRFNFNNDSSNFVFFFFKKIFKYSSINCESYIWKKIHHDTIKLLSIKNISVPHIFASCLIF